MANLRPLRNKVLIVGANGLLGQKLVKAFSKNFALTGTGRKRDPILANKDFQYRPCDMTKRSELRSLVHEVEPNTIINAAAYTNVDGCEDNKEECWRVNVTGVEYLAQAARSVDAFLVHISTDYVFDGKAGGYSETSTPSPISYYGRAKLASENAVLAAGIEHAIVRTMILYGVGHQVGPNFATWLAQKLSAGDPVQIVDDQFGHPTLVDDLALAIRRIAELRKDGCYHIAGVECVSRHYFAVQLAKVFGFDQNLITRIKTSDLHQKAPRPLNSSFNLEKSRQKLGIELSGIEKGLTVFKEQFQNSNL